MLQQPLDDGGGGGSVHRSPLTIIERQSANGSRAAVQKPKQPSRTPASPAAASTPPRHAASTKPFSPVRAQR